MSGDFTYAAPEPLTLDFDPPIKGAKGNLSRLTLREPTSIQVWTAEQHLVASNGPKGRRLYQKALVAKVGGVPEDVLDAVPISDFTRAARYLQDFVEAGLPTEDEPVPEGLSLTITLAEPIADVIAITLHEPTLGQMAKAESALGNMSPQRVRAYQESLVIMSSGQPAAVVSHLPISVLNRAASFVLGFSAAGRRTAT